MIIPKVIFWKNGAALGPFGPLDRVWGQGGEVTPAPPRRYATDLTIQSQHFRRHRMFSVECLHVFYRPHQVAGFVTLCS